MKHSNMFRRTPYNKRKTITLPQWSSNNKILVGTNRKTHLRNPNFDPEETKLLISLWGDPKVQRDLITTHKKHPVIAGIAEKMRNRGYNRSTEEINTRIKNLKCFYNRIKKEKESGMSSSWKHYDDMNEILSRPIFGNSNVVRKITTPPSSNENSSSASPNKNTLETIQPTKQQRRNNISKEQKENDDAAVNLLKFPDIKIKIEDASDDENSFRPEDLLKVENRITARQNITSIANQKPDDEDGIDETMLSLLKREPIELEVDEEAQDVDIDNDFDEDDIDMDEDDDDDDSDADDDDLDDLEDNLNSNITNYQNNINLSISSVQSKAEPRTLRRGVVCDPKTRPFELKLLEPSSSGSKAVVVAPNPPSVNNSVQKVSPSTQKKISLVPTNILLKTPQHSQMNFKPGTQQILYTKPNTVTTTTMPMQIVLVNTVPKMAGNRASAVTNVTQAMMTPNPIPSVSSTSSTTNSMNDNPFLNTDNTEEIFINKNNHQFNQQYNNPGVRIALNQIIGIQKESLALYKQRCDMKKEQFDKKQLYQDKILEVLSRIANALESNKPNGTSVDNITEEGEKSADIVMQDITEKGEVAENDAA